MLAFCLAIVYLGLVSTKEFFDIQKGICPKGGEFIQKSNAAEMVIHCSAQTWSDCTGFCNKENANVQDNFKVYIDQPGEYDSHSNYIYYKRIPSCKQKSSCGPKEGCKDLNYITNNNTKQHCISCPKYTCGPNCETENFIDTKDMDLYSYDIRASTLSGNPEVDLETCKDLCIAEKECKSIIYFNPACILKMANEDTVALKYYEGVIYSRRTCKCENQNC